jgi:hypothetical protein
MRMPIFICSLPRKILHAIKQSTKSFTLMSFIKKLSAISLILLSSCSTCLSLVELEEEKLKINKLYLADQELILENSLTTISLKNDSTNQNLKQRQNTIYFQKKRLEEQCQQLRFQHKKNMEQSQSTACKTRNILSNKN